ncbi:fatty acyl-AMP ligase [Streptomyces acidiscabies]|uniref:AMP-binding protein n=5 Tax=Streptomyces acidiscabies TaxID=42234 RepID=A0AAP6B4V7_9ACTN|nr:fatty acyl-AMP ligase [Streptomyces acidiscabies]MBZ3912666.1 AMP-binding protein [Streptomyces acidiscabies]MDX2958149.1 AMP-binding protein [Streptomyces acidiscabies]MDX3018516.1 AMP-binding protein [Streptomyces acidiscabies]MDX3791181.1 AMP-binding protein [Streptomyces acidiscabies]
MPEFPTLPAALSHWAAVRPDDTAYVFASPQGDADRTVSYRELEQSALTVAAFLRTTARPGDRVLLLLPPGLDYLTAFLGCLYAGTVAVPLYPPRPGAKLDRIEAVVQDCRPTHALTVDLLLDHLRSAADGLRLHSVEEIRAAGHSASLPLPRAGDLAFLQYTSGSTGTPKGVMVGHGNLAENDRAIAAGFGVRADDVILSWLPLYHDMGLIGTALLPLYLGVRAVLLDTFAFIHDPLSWPEAVSRYGATCSGGPNFAYQLLADRHDPERLAGLDLSSWRIAFNGAEPIIPATLERFADLYGRHGFDRGALYPCYGLAEATLFVSGAEPMAGYEALSLSRRAVESGRLEDAPPDDADRLDVVSCGRAAVDTEIVIRSADGRALPDGEIGEICVRGPGVAGGYWERPEASEDTFRARVEGRDGTFLRTGDLGALRDGRLYPVGRSKDLIIVAGRNFYPYDVENLASAASDDLRRGCAAAFQPELAEPRVVLVAEAARGAVARLRSDTAAVAELGAAVRRRVGAECGLDLADVVLVYPGSIPKTSSGKIRRAETRKRFLEGGLRLLGTSSTGNPTTQGETGSSALPARGGTESSALPARGQAGAPALLAPSPAGSPAASAPGAGPEALRAMLARLVAAHAGAEPGAEDFALPLAALGLDSLKLVALRGGIERQSGRRLDTELFYGDRSLDDIAEALGRTPEPDAGEPGAGLTDPVGRAAGADRTNPADPASLSGGADLGVHPATEGQVQFQFRHELLSEDTAHNLPVALRIGHRLDPARIRAALTAVTARHAALRTTLGEPGTATQVVHEPGALPLDFTHWEADGTRPGGTPLENPVPGDALPDRARLKSIAHRRFDLTRGPLVRAAAITSPDATTLLLTAHHTVVDYWSLRIVLADLLADLLGIDLPTPTEPPTAAEWLRHRTPATEAQLAEVAEKWRPLRDHLLFPAASATPRRRTPASLLDFATDAAEVYEDAKAHGQTPFVLLATAWLRALHEVTGEERIVIGTPYHHRDDWRFAGTVGCLVDMVPLLSDFRADPQDLRARTAQEVRAAQRSAAVPFARLVRELEPPRHGQNPLFQAILTFQQSADGLLGDGFAIPWSQAHQTLDGVEVRAVDVPPRDTAFAVSLYGARDGDRLVFRLEHQEHLVPATTAARLRDAFRAALAELTAPLARTGTTGG